MSEFKYVKVSWDELRVMPFEEVDKTAFYAYSNGKYNPAPTANLSLYAHEVMLYIKKEVDWWENIPKHGVLVWYKDVPVVVDYVINGICRFGVDSIWLDVDVEDCTPLTDKEIIEHFTGVNGE